MENDHEMTNLGNKYKSMKSSNDSYYRNNTLIAVDLKIVEAFASDDDKSLENFISENINDENYYIFIYCLTKKFRNNYLKYIKQEIAPKVAVEKLDFGDMTEDVFEAKYSYILLLNSLSQALNIMYKDFLKLCLQNDKKIPVPIIIRLLENEDLDIIKDIVDKKITIYDIENCSFLDKQTYFPEVFFYKMNEVHENIKVRLKNNFLTPKKIIYYMYKSDGLTETKRDNLVKDVIEMFNLNNKDILNSIIKMKDQDLAE